MDIGFRVDLTCYQAKITQNDHILSPLFFDTELSLSIFLYKKKRILKTFDGQIDLALLDIKLPDMDGGRVYPLIMEARPDLKVIVCSGYSIDGPAQAILDAGAEGFIQKPFLIAPFAKKLKEVLEGKKATTSPCFPCQLR